MKTNKHNTGNPQMPTLSRRAMLSAFAVSALPASALATLADQSAGPQPEASVSVDAFLSRATAAERASYHANALAEVMAEMHPERSWRSMINHEHSFALVVGDERPVFIVRKED